MFFDNNARNIEVKDYSLRILKIAGSILSILMELSNKFVYGIEFQFGTQVADKRKANVLFVNVRMEIKDIHFNATVGAISHCRTVLSIPP